MDANVPLPLTPPDSNRPSSRNSSSSDNAQNHQHYASNFVGYNYGAINQLQLPAYNQAPYGISTHPPANRMHFEAASNMVPQFAELSILPNTFSSTAFNGPRVLPAQVSSASVPCHGIQLGAATQMQVAPGQLGAGGWPTQMQQGPTNGMQQSLPTGIQHSPPTGMQQVAHSMPGNQTAGPSGQLSNGNYRSPLQSNFEREENFQPYDRTEYARNYPGQERVNQLGGHFANGRPLPDYMREQIVYLASTGMKPCDISRQMKVSHGCISKILNRYDATGSIKPGVIGGSRPRVITPEIEEHIRTIHLQRPEAGAAEIQTELVEQALCRPNDVPSTVSISRLLNIGGPVPDGDVIDLTERDNSFVYEIRRKQRRPRTLFTSEQLAKLELVFRSQNYPDISIRENLANSLGMPEDRVQVWFSNRRARLRKMVKAVKPSDCSTITAPSNENPTDMLKTVDNPSTSYTCLTTSNSILPINSLYSAPSSGHNTNYNQQFLQGQQQQQQKQIESLHHSQELQQPHQQHLHQTYQQQQEQQNLHQHQPHRMYQQQHANHLEQHRQQVLQQNQQPQQQQPHQTQQGQQLQQLSQQTHGLSRNHTHLQQLQQQPPHQLYQNNPVLQYQNNLAQQHLQHYHQNNHFHQSYIPQHTQGPQQSQ